MIRHLLPYLIVLMSWASVSTAGCSANSVEIRGDWGQARFAVELADTEELRERGLMYRESLPLSAGMLFVYPSVSRKAFWMKNTLLPLDMLFIKQDGSIESIHSNAVPHDLTPIFSRGSVAMVLEINGGLATRMGITSGSQLRHPLIDQIQAVWPC